MGGVEVDARELIAGAVQVEMLVDELRLRLDGDTAAECDRITRLERAGKTVAAGADADVVGR